MSYPPYSQYPHPHVPQTPPLKKSSSLPIVLMGIVATFGGCTTLCGYTAYHSQTPEGKREAREREEQERRERAPQMQAVRDVTAKLARVRSVLPKFGTPAVACPVGSKIEGLPMVDTLYMSALLDSDGTQNDERLEKSAFLRDSDFSSTLVSVAADARNDAGEGSTLAELAASEAKTIGAHHYMLVVRVDGMKLPKIDGDYFVGGELDGDVSAVDWQKETVVCHAPINAASSTRIKTGGGVGLKVGGIPLPGTIGGSGSLESALADDFKKNVDDAIQEALVSHS